jgi:hypothetical protein
MSKLPADFVRAPGTQPQPKPRAQRSRKASLISPEPVRNPRELMLTLTDEEYGALEDARKTLHRAGTEITLEQMIHRVFAEWMLRARSVVQPPPAANASDAAPRDEHLIRRLRAFVAEPLRIWRELAAQMWRTLIVRSS